MIIKTCKNCECQFETHRNDKQHCSKKCFAEYRKKPEVINNTLLKRKKTNIDKYGVDNPAKSEITKAKAKNTCIERYGEVSPTLNDVIRNKQINTCMELYGVSNPQQNENIKLKQQQSLYSNYGVNVPLKSEKILNKVKTTNLKKYGVENVAKIEEIKLKIKNTNILKYGVEYISQYGEFKQKQIQSRLETHYKYLIENENFTNIIPLFDKDEYKGNVSYDTKYKFKCKPCGSEFFDTLLSGNIPRCHKCNPVTRTQSENEVLEFIKTILSSENVISGDRSVLNKKELDIYIPTKNLAFEYNGLYWNSEISGKKYKNYHLNKTIDCEKKNIRLIHIFEDEWLYNKELIKNKITHILKENVAEKIYARKCEIREIPSDICNKFLLSNHIQGVNNSSVKLGAYYNNELVAVMTFGQIRMSVKSYSKKNHWELYRFCTSLNKRVIGIGGKLIKYFKEVYNPVYIVSYADIRWSQRKNNLYESLGLKYTTQTTPNYWYIGKNKNVRIHRFNFRKSVLKTTFPNFNDDMTEWQNMQVNGYDRIWDCGCYKYEWYNSQKM